MPKNSNPILQERRAQEVSGKAEKFWQAFRLTENGKVKSTLLLYSFFLCVLFIAVYGAAFAFLLDPLNAILAGAPELAVNLVEALVPAVVGALLCSVSWLLMKDKRILVSAYLWMLVLALACLVTVLILLREEDWAQLLFLQFFALIVPAPILLGGGSACAFYARWRKKHPVVNVELNERNGR